MQEAIFRHYGRLQSIDLHVVERPAAGDDQVLVRMRATSVNAGDWHALRGRPYLIRASGGLRRPRKGRLGVDMAGLVEEVGANVTQFAPGDEIFGMIANGAFAEYVVADTWIAAKPATLTFEEAAAVPAAGCTALQAVRDRGDLKPGEQVLIYGAGGGVGTFAVQLAKAFGGEVTALTSKVAVARSIGPDHVVDYTRDGLDRLEGRFDLVIDIGATRSFGALRRLLVPDGRLVVVGAGRGIAGPIGRFAAAAVRSRLVRQRITAFVAGPPFAENLETLRTFIEAGTVRPVIDATYPFARTGDAVARFAGGRASGKVVISIP